MIDDLQRIAEGLASRLGRAIAIDDPQLYLITHTAHDKHVDPHRVASVMAMRAPDQVVEHALAQGIAAASVPVRVPGIPDIDFLARLCVPVRCQGLLFGYVWIIDDEATLSEEEVALAVEAAAAAGQVLYRERLVDDLRDSRERDLLRDVLSEDPTVRAAAAGLLLDEEMLPPEPHLCALVVQVDASSDDVRLALDGALKAAGRRASPLASLCLSRAGGRGILLLAGRREPPTQDLRAVASMLRDDLAKRLADGADICVGIGPVVRGAEAAAGSAQRARQALEVARVVTELGPVTAWEELGVYRLLVSLPLRDLPEDAVPLSLRMLMEADGEGPLVETLETWLDEGCDSRATVARLQVHRTSLYYRLGRIEEITGASLSSGSVRLDLHLGLKLARLKGLLGK